MKGSREHNYVTHTLAEHHRIVREGDRFKKDVSRIQGHLSGFILEVSVSEREKFKSCDGEETRNVPPPQEKGKGKKGNDKAPPLKKTKKANTKTPKLTIEERAQRTKQKKACKRLEKIKRADCRKRLSRAEVDTMLKASLLRLSDWSQRACDIMQQQMKDITKLYMATMNYNIHLNSAYPVLPMPSVNH